KYMAHINRTACARRQERGIQRDVADVSTGNFQASQAGKVERSHIRLFRKSAMPYAYAVRSRRKWKVHQEPEPPQECLVQERFPVGRKDGQPAIIFHALQQIIDFYVRITIMAVAHFTALAE